jgi:chromosome segregation ATPase
VDRAEHSMQILDDVVNELSSLESRFAETEEFIKNHAFEIPIREGEVVNLQQSLDRKISQFKELEKEMQSLAAVIDINHRRIDGLTIR